MSQELLLGAFVTAAYVTRQCFHRPNPIPTERHSEDSMMFSRFLPDAREWIFLILQSAHVILASQWPPQPSILCPNPTILNKDYFTWSPITSLCIGLILLTGPIRLLAFEHLGKDFTFELARPSKLVTDGVYKYVQHPSYLPDGIVSFANFVLFANLDGWVGCFLPVRLIEFWQMIKTPGMIAFMIPWFVLMSVRVREEEAMLKQSFGRSWEQYNQRTARFIPFIY